MIDGVQRTRLDNGLTVLLRQMDHAPVATFWVWYDVGSRVEARPRTGLTHWVEHMLFRGTERFPGPSVHKMISREGGTRNGFTSNDYTAYFETLPAERIDLALQLESDRMLNARFTADDVEAERTIILSERAGRENQSSYRLREALLAAAFPDHGYGHPVLGWEEDLRRITRDELWDHYSTYYGPDNAVVVAAGDFDRGALLDRIVELFGSAPPRLVSRVAGWPATSTSSDRQQQRRVLVTGAEPVAYVQLLFPIVEATHPDYFPLLVLDTVLGGAKPMSFAGGGVANRSSRLYKALVMTELAASAGCSVRPTTEPFAFTAAATVRRGIDPQQVEDALWAELERMVARPLDPAELARAYKQTLAQFAYSSESAGSQGYWLGFSEIVAQLGWFLDLPTHLAAVTAGDVQRVAAIYLQPDHAAVGWYVPESAGES
jgi:zinc protease